MQFHIWIGMGTIWLPNSLIFNSIIYNRKSFQNFVNIWNNIYFCSWLLTNDWFPFNDCGHIGAQVFFRLFWWDFRWFTFSFTFFGDFSSEIFGDSPFSSPFLVTFPVMNFAIHYIHHRFWWLSCHLFCHFDISLSFPLFWPFFWWTSCWVFAMKMGAFQNHSGCNFFL